MKDKSGKTFKSGDLIVYAGTEANVSKLTYGVVLDIVRRKQNAWDSHKVECLRVIGSRNFQPGFVNVRDRILIINKSQIDAASLKSLRKKVKKYGH